jgi:hypothetical protein
LPPSSLVCTACSRERVFVRCFVCVYISRARKRMKI